MADITGRTIIDLPGINPAYGVDALAGRTPWANKDCAYEWAIGGLPFLSAASDRYPLKRAFAQQRKQQLDTSTDPGEQSFSTWWVRSQQDFTGGAGRINFDPGTDKIVMTQFTDSLGVDTFSTTGLTLLPSMSKQVGTSGAAEHAVTFGASSVVYASGTTVATYPAATTATASGVVNDVANLNGAVYLAQQDSKLTKFDGTTITSPISAAAGPVLRVWSVKNRLMVVVGTDVFEVGTGTTTFPVTPVAQGGAGWTWTGCCALPDAVLLAGHDGTKSYIYSLKIGDNGTLPTLTAPAVMVDLPAGELVTCLTSYLGSIVVIGTNRGPRVGVIENLYGRMTTGPLLFSKSVAAVTVWDRFAYCAVTQGQADGYTGVFKVDLSNQVDEAGRFAYASGVRCGVTSTATSIAMIGTTGRVAVCANGLYQESATAKEASGWVKTGLVRFSTQESKFFDTLKIRGTAAAGSITVESVDENGLTTTLSSLTDSIGTSLEMAVYPGSAQPRLGFKFTLNSADSLTSPSLTSWQVKALPGVTREQLWQIPLMCFDEEQDRFGVRSSQGDAVERWDALKAVAALGSRILVQDLTSGDSALAIVDDLQFDQHKPPAKASGFGGIVIITVRVI